MEYNLTQKQAIECLEQMICARLDKNGYYLFVSRRWQELMGFTQKQVLGRRVDELVPDTHAMEAIQTGQVIQGRPVIRNGIPIFTSYIPLKNKHQELQGVFLYTVVNGIPNAKDILRQTELLKKQVEFYRQELSSERGARYHLDNIIGQSPAICHLKEQISQAAKSTSTVLIEGETGSGKELIAHSIHALSPRRDGNFVRVNCSAIPAELMESEFFGYAAGAFTGAARTGKIGRFELANGGSLFLDEVNLLPQTMQPKFLRVLQEREVDPVGSTRTIPVDVRVIAAANIPLEQSVQAGQFRSDLYYRLNVIHIVAPPLRQRMEDMPLLVDHLIKRLNAQLGMMIQRVSDEVMDLFMAYDWPGNIRELQNAIESAMNMTHSFTLVKEDFEPFILRSRIRKRMRAVQGGQELLLKSSKSHLERELVQEALSTANGNRSQAARLLGISRTLLYKKLRQYGLE